MKKFLIACLALGMMACSKQEATTQETATPEKAVAEITPEMVEFYGDSIALDGAQPIAELASRALSGEKPNGKVEGTIVASCQNKGCWMKVALNDSSTIMVKFKDYGFFVPTEDLSGRKVIMDGFAFADTTSVEDLRHYAEDEGKKPEEVAKINAPEIAPKFEANGVAILKK